MADGHTFCSSKHLHNLVNVDNSIKFENRAENLTAFILHIYYYTLSIIVRMKRIGPAQL